MYVGWRLSGAVPADASWPSVHMPIRYQTMHQCMEQSANDKRHEENVNKKSHGIEGKPKMRNLQFSLHTYMVYVLNLNIFISFTRHTQWVTFCFFFFLLFSLPFARYFAGVSNSFVQCALVRIYLFDITVLRLQTAIRSKKRMTK